MISSVKCVIFSSPVSVTRKLFSMPTAPIPGITYFMGTKQQAKFVGHGIGIQINELPVLTPRSKDMLEPNMVFV